MNTPVRTRFAPSPTGYLHVGGIRTALFAWLVARQAGGQFILRIEDTDRARQVEGAESHIIASLRALGLNYDEGPDQPGKYGPYRQTERLERYKSWGQTLIDSGRAYADPYSTDQVQQFRQQAQKAKQPFLYRNQRPDNPPAWDGKTPLRFKSDPQDYHWHDAVMGDLHAGAEAVDDFILIKSDGFPTYNFAHICDDHDMAITHVIRGQEFLASVPNYLNLYEALGLVEPEATQPSATQGAAVARTEPYMQYGEGALVAATPQGAGSTGRVTGSAGRQGGAVRGFRPVLATMPHILNEQGNKKLSKRDGAKDVLDYFKQGYLEEAVLNFIATLGWNDGTTQELFSREELLKKFSLDRVGKSGARFDDKRLEWMGGAWMRRLDTGDLYARCQDFWPGSAKKYDDEYKKRVLGLVQERLKYFAELPGLTSFFFEDLPVDKQLIEGNKQLSKFSRAELRDMLAAAKGSLTESDFSVDDLTERLNNLLEATGQKPGVLFSLIRIATTQATASPALAGTLHVLGKDRSLSRIDATLAALS